MRMGGKSVPSVTLRWRAAFLMTCSANGRRAVCPCVPRGGMFVTGAGQRRSRVMAAPKGDAPTLISGEADVTLDGASQHRATGLAGLVLLVAVAAGLLGQGGYYPPVQRYIGALVAAATVLALAAWPPTRGEARLLPVVPALALAAWAVVDGALLGVPGPGFRRRCCSSASSRCSWSAAASGRRTGRSCSSASPASAWWWRLLAGLGATMSRAGAFALAVGLLVLAGLRGPGVTARAAAGPLAGAVVALACLLPSVPAASPPRPALALAGLCAGLSLAAVVARRRRQPRPAAG